MSESVTSPATYLKVFIALACLLLASVVFAMFDWGPLNTVIAMGISVAKAVLIVTFFMHLNSSASLVRIVAVGGILWLVLMFLLTFADYQTRPENTDAAKSVVVEPISLDK